MRSGTDVPDDGATGGPADPLAAAAGLRWSRPDLTAALADHVLETAAVTDDRDLWLRAAGWAVHARSATGDGRDTAADVIDCLPDWGPESLGLAAAGRLRVELALVAVNIGRTDAASALLGPVAEDGVAVELRADAFGALARCAVEDDADRVENVLEQAEDAWAGADAAHRDLGLASAALIGAAAHRRAGRPVPAVARAAAGLARLERGPDGSAGTGSGHLTAALAAEWILALLDAGQTDEARRGCVQLAPRLVDCRPSRQVARLRLAVARTNAARSSAGDTAQELSRAVRDAAECDAPDLEAVCCSALGTVYEKAGRPDIALTTVERGVAAQRVDRSRATRFREALASLPMEVLAVDNGLTGRVEPTRATPFPGGPRSDLTRPAIGRPGADGVDRPDPTEVLDVRPGRAVSGAAESGAAADVPDDRRSRRAAADPLGSGAPAGGRNGRTRPGSGGVDDATSRISRADVDGSRGDRVEPVPPRRSRHGLAVDRAWQVGDFASPSRAADAPGRTQDPTDGGRNGRTPLDHPDNGTVNGTVNGAHNGTVNGAGGRSVNGTSNGRGRPGGGREAGAADHAAGAAGNGTEPGAGDPASWGTAWDDAGDSPIGDLLMRSLRSAGEEDRPATERPGRAAAQPSSDGLTRPATERSAPDRVERPVNGAGLPGGRRRADADDPAPAGRENRRGDVDRSSGTGRDVDPAEPPRSHGGSARTSSPTGEGPREPVARRTAAEELEARRSAAGRSGSSSVVADWLAAELADVDRIWERISEPVAPTGVQPDLPGGGEDCVVSIDIARDGRRQVGRRSAKLVRALAGALADRLPAGGRLEQDEPCVLSVVLAGADDVAAEDWMRRALTAVLDADPTDLHAPGLVLRAAVRDRGPTGPQFVRDLPGSADGAAAEEAPAERSEPVPPAGRPGRRRRDDGLHRPALPLDERTDEAAGHRRDTASGRSTAADGAGSRNRSDRGALPPTRPGAEAGRDRPAPDAGGPIYVLGRPRAAGAGAPADRTDASTGEPRSRARRDLDALDSYRAERAGPGRFRADRFGPGRGDADRSDLDGGNQEPAEDGPPSNGDDRPRSRNGSTRTVAGDTGSVPDAADRPTPGRRRADRLGADPLGLERPEVGGRASRHNSDRRSDGPETDRGRGSSDPGRETGGSSSAPVTGRRRSDRSGTPDVDRVPPRHADPDPAPPAEDGAPPAAGSSPAEAGGNRGERSGVPRRRIDASTEGLGLADLLAGALAEYRGI